MRILADANILFAAEAFGVFGEVQLAPGRGLSPEMVRDRDVVLVRSVTPVGRELLDGSRVRFVGSATSGTDHVDRAWLAERGIAFAHAPGCNAGAVADYVLSALAALASVDDRPLKSYTVGIVGCGAVGGRLLQRLEALGVACLANDPPRARAGAAGPFVGLPELLAESEVVTLHVPLTRTGPYATVDLIGRRAIERMRRGAVLVNTARGGVVDEAALLAALDRGSLRAVVDCWQGEPAICAALLERVQVGTPHIAGYSLDGRLAATRALHAALGRFLGQPQPWPAALVAPWAPPPPLAAADCAPAECVRRLVLACYDVRRDSAALKAGRDLPAAGRALLFDRLRRDYPARREFAAVPVRVPAGRVDLAAAITAAGFGAAASPS